MKWIDVPPIWLLLGLVVAWYQVTVFPFGLSFGGAWSDFVGGLCVGGGVLLIGLAFVEFHRHKTTALPHAFSSHLIQTGIFARTRNPVYLGDVLILIGLIFRWDAVLSLLIVPIFIWILERRFIVPEENRLRQKFGTDFVRYQGKVRRWV